MCPVLQDASCSLLRKRTTIRGSKFESCEMVYGAPATSSAMEAAEGTENTEAELRFAHYGIHLQLYCNFSQSISEDH